MKIKQIIINGDIEELEFIARILCGVMHITELSSYTNTKDEGLMVLSTRKGEDIFKKIKEKENEK